MPIPSARTVETVNKRGRNPRQVRISVKVRNAVRFMVYEGLNRRSAAEKAGLTDHALYTAFRKPQVKAFMQECMGDLRESAAAQSLARVNDLAGTAKAESVKLDANKFLLGLQGISPVQRSEQHVTAELRVTPGYVIDLTSASAPVIEGEGHEVTKAEEDSASVPQGGRQGDGTGGDEDGG